MISKKFFIEKLLLSQSNQKGQAALVDSLFFLSIVSVVCGLLFIFYSNYGTMVESSINSFYSSDFAVDSLKVITYVNVLRDGREVYTNLDAEMEPQYDYLFTLIKEDYADVESHTGSGKLKPTTKKAIRSVLSSVMKPFENSIDYVFYIANNDANDFLFLMFALHDYNHGNFDEINPDLNVKYYFCRPQRKDLLSKLILPNVGKSDQAVGKITLPEGNSGRTIFVVGLYMWVSRDYPVLRYITTPGSDDEGNNFNCTDMDTIP